MVSRQFYKQRKVEYGMCNIIKMIVIKSFSMDKVIASYSSFSAY